MVYGAQACGCTFIEHKTVDGQEVVVVERRGNRRVQFEVLASIDFNSTRKRMSVLFKRQDGSCVLYCKGADNVVTERLQAGDPQLATVQVQLDDLAKDGLRTLCLANKVLDEAAGDAWVAQYLQAKNESDKARMTELEVEMENDMQLLGCTGVEDKLQDRVPEALKTLLGANVKTWVLTGDKKDTAINIGHKCNLLNHQMKVVTEWPDVKALIGEPEGGQTLAELESERMPVVMRAMRGCLEGRLILLDEETSPHEKVQRLACLDQEALAMTMLGCGETERWALLSIAKGEAMLEVSTSPRGMGQDPVDDDEACGDDDKIEAAIPRLADGSLCVSTPANGETPQDLLSTDHINGLVIEGPTLKYILNPVDAEGEAIKMLFLEVACKCLAVIGCRVSPKQKSQIVCLVRDNQPGMITLAIGDGANDVPMIQAAHVGVGIRGKEGSQAVNASDYAIGTFRFLVKLMLVHGHYNYRRQVMLMCYMVYKGAVLVLPAFFYQFSNKFSGQEMYEQSAYQLYNPAFTALPIIVFGVFDQDLLPEVVMRNLKLYSIGQNDDLTSGRVIAITWSSAAFLHGALIFLIPYAGASQAHQVTIFEFGVYAFTCVVCVVDIRVVLMMGTLKWHWITWFFITGSIIFYFFAELISDSYFLANVKICNVGVAQHAMAYADFWLGLLWVVIVCSLGGLLRQVLPMLLKELDSHQGEDLVFEIQKIDQEKQDALQGRCHENSDTIKTLSRAAKRGTHDHYGEVTKRVTGKPWAVSA